MIIIYDINEKVLNSRNISISATLDSKEKKNVELFVKQKYLSLFGPIGTLGLQEVIAVDTVSDAIIPKKQWTEELKTEAKYLKDETPFAWGLFRNLYIIAGVFLALIVVAPVLNKNRAANETERLKAMEADFSTTGPGDLLMVFLHGNADGSGSKGVTMMKVLRLSGDTLVVKRHKEIAAGFKTEDAAALDHKDEAFKPDEEKYKLGAYNDRNKILLPFPSADNTSPSAVASVRDIEKAK